VKWNTNVMDEEKFLIQTLWILNKDQEFLLEIYLLIVMAQLKES